MFNRLKNIISKISDLDGSVDSYKQDSVIQSLPSVAYVNKAKKLIDKQKYSEAEVILRKALDISQQDPNVYKYLGKIVESRYEFQNAAQYYDKSAKLNPQDKEIWLRLGMCRLHLKMYEEAIGAFEQADKITPMNTDVHTGWGMVLMRQKKYALARDKFQLACKISKYNFTAILLCAVMEIRLCDYESAEKKLKFLVKAAPNESSAYEYAHLKLLKSDFKEAEKYAKKSLEYNKGMLPSYFILAEIYSLAKDFKKTEEVFQNALEQELNGEALQFEWGKACVRMFEFELASEHFSRACEFSDSFSDAKIGLALTDALKGDFELLNELKEKNGDNVYIQEALGLQMFACGRFNDAVDMFKKALRTDSNQSYNNYHLAKAYIELKNSSKAREYFEQFTSENPQYLAGLLEYSKWLISVEDFAQAQRKLIKAQKLDGDNNEILNLLFYVSYVLVKENLCEYNIKETLKLADKAINSGEFRYSAEKEELEHLLTGIK